LNFVLIEDWIEKIGTENIRFVKLFREIWADMDSKENEAEIIESILHDIAADNAEIVGVLKKPTQGVTSSTGSLSFGVGKMID